MTRVLTPALAAIVAIVAMTVGACDRAPEFDLIVRGGSVIDGTGQEAQRLDVGVNGDRITALADLSDRTAAQIIEAAGKTVAPGFIDVHATSGIDFLSDGYGESHLRQGVTTEVLGRGTPAFWTAATADAAALRQRGLTLDWTTLGGFMNRLQSRGLAMNVGTFALLSNARASGNASAFVDAALTAGAFGVVEDADAGTAGLHAVAAAIGRRNGLLITPVDGPVAASDDVMFDVGGAAQRIVIGDLSRVASPDALTDLMRRVVRARDRKMYVATATTMYPPAGASDASVVDALKVGSLIESDSPAVPAASANAGAPAAAFGTFPRLFGHFVREQGAIDIREAVRRSTSGAAAALDVPMRGILREKYFADLVVFDPRAIAEGSSAPGANPLPSGIDYVVVNGVVVMTPTGLTGARPGAALTHGAATR